MKTVLVDDRDTALKVGYAASYWPFPVSYDLYLKSSQDWNVQAIVKNGKCIGTLFTRNDEFHLSILPEWKHKWCNRELLKQIFDGPKRTQVCSANDKQIIKMLKKLGFVEHGEWMIKEK